MEIASIIAFNKPSVSTQIAVVWTPTGLETHTGTMRHTKSVSVLVGVQSSPCFRSQIPLVSHNAFSTSSHPPPRSF
jgi:hypothetical protein